MAVNIDDACKNVHLLMSATEYDLRRTSSRVL